MAKYRVRPNNVEAEKFTGNNWYVIEKWLGPHLTKTVDNVRDHTDSAHYVFDIDDKNWLLVTPGNYIVKYETGSIRVTSPADFENKWEREPTIPNLWPKPIPGSFPPFGPAIGYEGDSSVF